MAGDHENVDLHVLFGRGYPLGGSYNAAARLNFQFYLWKESMKFNIHPSIPTSGQDIHIADVATGTAIWLAEVAHELLNAKVDGFDIDLTHAPPKEWLPSNTQLKHWNIFDDPPDELLGKYDIVHVRLLMLVVENSDPRPIIRNLVKILKPSGYLQWDEPNYSDTHVKNVNKSLQTPALQELRDILDYRDRNDWQLQLDVIANKEGFEDARLYHFGDRLDMTKANNELILVGFEELASRLDRADTKEEASKIYQLLQAAYKECLKGAAICIPRVVCVARKAG